MPWSEIVYSICTTLPSQILAYYPFWNNLRFSKRTCLTLCGLGILFKALVMLPLTEHGIGSSVIEFFFVPLHMAIYYLNIRVHPLKLLFTYLFVWDYAVILRGVSSFLCVRWLQAPLRSWTECGLCLLLAILSLSLLLRFFREAARRIYRINAPIWSTIWLVPTLTSAIVLLFTSNYTPEMAQSWTFLMARIVLIVCLFVVYAILLRSLESFQRQTLLESQKQQAERIVLLQQEQYNSLLQQEEEIRRFRHDFHHQLVMLRQYAAEKDYGKLIRYLDQLLGAPSAEGKRVCPNPVVNAVALHLLAHGETIPHPEIHLEQIPADCGRAESDLCVLVGNLLTNAITACRDVPDPVLRMNSRFDSGLLTITMQNSFSHVDQLSDGSFRSTKPGGGIGLLSIQSIAEKYGGGCRFQVEDGLFFSAVYLQLQPEMSDPGVPLRL